MLSHLSESVQIIAKHTLSYLGELKSQKVVIGGETFSYLEGGKGPTLLLLHGLGGSKTQWRTVMQLLSNDFRVIAVEMPGFSLQQLGHPNYRNIRDMVGWLQRFVDGVRLNSFHLLAACSGAVIATTFALQNTDRVDSLTAVGLPDLMKRDSVFELIKKFQITSLDDVDNVFGMVFYRAPAVPAVIKRMYVAQSAHVQKDFDSRINEILLMLPQLVPKLRSLKLPVLLVSGTNDLFSGSEVLAQSSTLFANKAEVHQIDKCGHLPFIEKPEQLVDAFRGFQNRLLQTRA